VSEEQTKFRVFLLTFIVSHQLNTPVTQIVTLL
jgi:hypothetical protein